MESSSDPAARLKLAALARRLAAGQLTNREFERAVPSSTDGAVYAVFHYGLWPLYDDFAVHRLTGKWALTSEGRSWVARLVLFLRSDQPYRYYTPSRWGSLFTLPLALVSFGLFTRLWLRYKWRKGDRSVWPFYSRAEYEQALRSPTFLNRRDAA